MQAWNTPYMYPTSWLSHVNLDNNSRQTNLSFCAFFRKLKSFALKVSKLYGDRCSLLFQSYVLFVLLLEVLLVRATLFITCNWLVLSKQKKRHLASRLSTDGQFSYLSCFFFESERCACVRESEEHERRRARKFIFPDDHPTKIQLS